MHYLSSCLNSRTYHYFNVHSKVLLFVHFVEFNFILTLEDLLLADVVICIFLLTDVVRLAYLFVFNSVTFVLIFRSQPIRINFSRFLFAPNCANPNCNRQMLSFSVCSYLKFPIRKTCIMRIETFSK